MMKTKYFSFALLALLIAGCKKTNSISNQWTLGSSVYQVNGFGNYADTNKYVSFLSLDYAAGGKQIPCTITFLRGSYPPSSGSYQITDAPATKGLYIQVMDSANRTWVSHSSPLSATVQLYAPSQYQIVPYMKSISIPRIWVYNVSAPGDSLQFSANMIETE